MRRSGRGTLLLLAGLIPLLGGTRRHPLHTTFAEVRDSAGTIAITVRGFEDDLTRAAASSGGGDSAVGRYVTRHFLLEDAPGHPVSLAWKGTRKEADVLWVELRSAPGHTLATARVRSTLLCDRFDDQVNLVRVWDGGRSRTLLFTSGDPPRPVRR